jgi:hypothetical protein
MMKLVTTVALLCVTSGALAGNAGMAMSTKELNDDIRATIVKEMAIMQQFQVNPNNVDDDSTTDSHKQNGCKMDVGSVDSPRPGARKVTTVVTGSVVQICK